MNSGVGVILILLTAFLALVLLLVKCSSNAMEDCRRAGGVPVMVRTTVVCFEPGVVKDVK